MSNNTLTYNGVTIDWIKTNRFEQEAIYDDSNTDYIYTKITIAVTGVLSNCIQGSQPWDWITTNRPLLMATRGQLIFNCDGSTMFHTTDQLLVSPLEDDTTDAKLGPFPKALNISKLDGQTWMIYYEIETYVIDCDNEDPATVLNNRWECTYNVDNEYYQTRTINGTVWFNGTGDSSDNLDYAEDAGIIVPTIPQGWQREAINVVLSADGLKLNYTIQDKSTHFAMPSPAVAIDFQYSETAGLGKSGDLHIQQNECNITVKGEPGSYTTAQGGRQSSTTKSLLQIMFQLVLSRMNPNIAAAASSTPPPIGEFVTYFQLRENVYKNEVGCRVITILARQPQVLNTALTINFATGNFNLTRVGLPIKINSVLNNLPRTPDNIGNYLFYLFAAAVQTPCDDMNKSINNQYAETLTDTVSSPANYITVGTSIPATTPVGPTTYTTGYSEQHYQFPFTHLTIDVTYPQDYHTKQFGVMYDQAPNCVLIKTAANTLKRVVHWKAHRIGDWPLCPNPTNILPDPVTGIVQDMPLNSQVSIGNIELASDGNMRNYTINGIFEYANWKPIDYSATYTMYASVNTITTDAWNSYGTKVDNTKFIPGIIGPGAAPGGGPAVQAPNF